MFTVCGAAFIFSSYKKSNATPLLCVCHVEGFPPKVLLTLSECWLSPVASFEDVNIGADVLEDWSSNTNSNRFPRLRLQGCFLQSYSPESKDMWFTVAENEMNKLAGFFLLSCWLIFVLLFTWWPETVTAVSKIDHMWRYEVNRCVQFCQSQRKGVQICRHNRNWL